jgi:hypothetical protein
VLQERHVENKKLLNTNKEEVIIVATKLPYKRSINWNKQFLEEVIKETAKDGEYLEALQTLGKENETIQSTVHQEGVLYRQLKLWVACGLPECPTKRTRLQGSWPHGTG